MKNIPDGYDILSDDVYLFGFLFEEINISYRRMKKIFFFEIYLGVKKIVLIVYWWIMKLRR